MSSLYHHPTFGLVRAIFKSIFNNLTPVLWRLVSTGLKFVRAQVLPRIVAAITAFIDPPPPRFQPRDPPVIIIIPVVTQSITQPTFDNPPSEITTSQDPVINPPFTFVPYRLTPVTPFAVTVGLLLAGTR